MGKKRKNTAIEQIMDELNEEIQPSLNSSPDLFVSGLVEENHSLEQEEKVQEIESLIHFDPHKIKESEQNNQSQDKGKSAEAELDIPSSENPVSKKEIKAESSVNKVKKSLEDRGLFNQKKSYKKINFKAEPVSKIKKGKRIAQESIVSHYMDAQNVSSQNNIPMRITLQQSENLRVAQERIVALEMEIERLRTENEDLIATGDIFRERLDKVIVQNDNLKKTYEESRQEFQDEKRTLMDTLNSQTREIEKINIKNKELEKRLSSNIQQIRVRERELENRLELMKLDNQTLAREKDQYILDLKRQIDMLKIDLESQKNKHNETTQKLEKFQSQNRQVSRGLQMILHIARGSDTSYDSQQEPKKTTE